MRCRCSILGSGLPSNWHQQPFPGQLRSRRIASPIALPPPSVSSTTSTAARHHQATPKSLVASAIPTAAPRHWSYPAVPSSNLIPDRRLRLGVRVRSCLAWSDAGSGQSTVDSRQGSLSQTKKKIGEVQLSEIRTAAALPALHPPPSTGTDRCCPSHRQIRATPPSPSPVPVPVPVPVLRITACLSSSQAVVACRRQSPVASRQSPVTHPCRSPPTRSCTHPRRPPPPPSTVHPRASQLSQQPAIIPRAHPRHRPSQRTATPTTLPPRAGL